MLARLFCMTLFTLLILTGCNTGYHSQDAFGNGFKDYRLSTQLHKVEYYGHHYSNNNRMERNVLRRAAVLCKRQGSDSFLLYSSINHAIDDVRAQSVSLDDSSTDHPIAYTYVFCRKQAADVGISVAKTLQSTDDIK